MVSFFLPVSEPPALVSAPESVLQQALSMVSCLSNLGSCGLPVSSLLLGIQRELLVFQSVPFSLVRVEWQLPSSCMWNQKPKYTPPILHITSPPGRIFSPSKLEGLGESSGTSEVPCFPSHREETLKAEVPLPALFRAEAGRQTFEEGQLQEETHFKFS